ncbi:uncharacterized protein [Dendrobates tinctorius]|uniref:uncharacterized protein isoform X2 n=1 Tax=Dendrobates tinctorius TaxID=92724 RepID=UPI003CCA04B0
MKSKNQREIHPAVSNIPSADDNHRTNTGFLIQKYKIIEEITTLEKYINFLQKKIEERTIDLENLKVTEPKKRKRWFRRISLSRATDKNTTKITESGKHTEFTKNWIVKMKEIKQSFEKSLEEKKTELDSIEEILEETPKQMMEEDIVKDNIAAMEETIENKANNTNNKSSLQSFLSHFSYFRI